MENKKVILCPINKALKFAPGHLLFGANYLEVVAKKEFSQNIEVRYLWFKQTKYTAFSFLLLNLQLCFRILFIQHDILYYGTDPNNLVLVSFFKKIGLYRKKMYAWKYIALSKTKYKFLTWLKGLFYSSFDCLFMLTESHVDISKENYMGGHYLYVEWGEDVDYVSKIKKHSTKSTKMTFISTGKAYRDFETLCEAFKNVDAKLKILTTKTWGNENYKEILSKYDMANVDICFVDEIKLEENESVLDYIYSELKAADCSMVICKKVNFGVGFTAILDAMVCNTAVIATYHKDNPIDIDKICIGKTVQAENVQDLHEKVTEFVEHPELVNNYKKRAMELINSKYNIKNVAKQVLNIMLK